MQGSFIKQLSEVNQQDVKLVGGKAASLGEMLSAGIPVPGGFVITTDAFRTGLSQELENEILQAFDALKAERVAVRSSAVAEDSISASWAGQLETYLNTTKGELLNAVTKCWESIKSGHAAAYAAEHGVDESQQAVAVVVQAMVDSETSGVLFTANPVTENRDEVIIEAVYGLGELLVQGMVTPETLRIDKSTGKVSHRLPSKQRTKLIHKNGKNQEAPVASSAKPIISDRNIKDLVTLADKIERHYKVPQDIEWAIRGDQLFIVQSRPITTLGEAQAAQPTITFSKTFTREESLIFCELLGGELDKWLSDITPTPPPAQLVRISRGLAETWLCEEATQLLVNDVYKNNTEDPNYLNDTVKRYKDLIAQLHKHEKRGYARNLDELKQYFELFRQAVVPLHVIFFTPLRPDTPKPLRDLALKIRGEDALFDNGDLYIRDSLVKLYPKCNGVETFIGLDDLEKPDIAKLKVREDDFIWFDGQYLSSSLGEFRNAHPNYSFKVDEIDRDQNTIEGSVAYRGIVEGKVQLILRKKEVADFEAGNILVAPMTTPHYLPAMRKAIAFVTDEGGVTCHAAIVAREMKTPCIIGTDIATEFLANGDLVRVDADKGIVTKL
ncbi:MAG TPA: PEP/pyruvate-binding domain-containing protein [Candidatus Dormibacteraeota bacterium]|nr:PEP/pyruvate-binding domain-containing protein [Candidatus Dormibacteraeota bacterium]